MGYIKGNILSYFVQPVGMKDFSVLFNTRKMARVLQAFDLIKFDPFWTYLIQKKKIKNQMAIFIFL